MRYDDITLEHGDGCYVARYATHRYRFLLNTGAIIDVEAVEDGSTLRGVLLSTLGLNDVVIAGVAEVDAPPPKPARRTRKKAS